ncbi:MAG: ABC transporter ATP-binding protein, partial [Euryarchaeota archaeon]|nr:ABC transporter ATP-binding protein [Euryarchaeota archaeon]
GTLLADGADLARVKSRDLAKLLGYAPQSINHSFPATVFDTVLLERTPYVDWSISSEDIEIVSNIISLMGLKGMALRQSNELSGGGAAGGLYGKSFSRNLMFSCSMNPPVILT